MKNLSSTAQRVVTGLIFAVIFWGTFLYLSPIFFSGLLALIASVIIVFEWKHFVKPQTAAFWLTVPLYPLLPFVLLMVMNQTIVYRPLLRYLFATAFAHDTGSYIVGKLIGKHRICPSISPNKTWEGFWGGYGIACIVIAYLVWWYNLNLSMTTLLLLTLITCTLSFLGDSFESYFKRRAGIKDSGTLLPGHGGFLDRFDGILFTTYFFFVFRNYLLTLLS